MIRSLNLTSTARKTADVKPAAAPLRIALASAGLSALIAGCGTTQLNEPVKSVPVESRLSSAPGDSSAGGAAAGATPQSQVATVDLSNRGGAGSGSMNAPGQRIVYFDFDSFAIKGDDQPVIDGFARVLQAGRDRRLVIEGHTDERGGREYNLALGQKRAAAVVRSLTLLGASENQLEAVSFGEERPAAPGTEESAWAKNRRAELKDR